MPKKAHPKSRSWRFCGREKVADICRKVGISEGTYYCLEETVRRVGDQ